MAMGPDFQEEFLLSLDPIHLTDDELDYELYIRKVQGFTTHREKSKALRHCLLKESKGEYPSPILTDLNDANEALVCLRKCRELEQLLVSARADKDPVTFSELESRVYALSRRLRRIGDKSVSGFDDCHKAVTLLCEFIEERKACNGKTISSDTATFLADASVEKVKEKGGAGLTNEPRPSDRLSARGRGLPISLANIQSKNLSLSTQVHNAVNDMADHRSDPFGHFGLNKVSSMPALARDERSHVATAPCNDFILNQQQCADAVSESDSDVRQPVYNMRRNYIPVHKWKISFSGESTGMSAKKFMAHAEMIADSSDVSRLDLFQNIHHLLRGKAADWYLANYNKFANWNQFRRAFEGHFLPSNYDNILLDQIAMRMQSKTESVGSYVTDMQNLFQCLTNPVSQSRQIHVVLTNMQPEYSEKLSLQDFNSLDTLATRCKRLDEQRFRNTSRLRHELLDHSSLLEPSFFPQQSRRFQPNTFSRGPAVSEVKVVHDSSDLVNLSGNSDQNGQVSQRNFASPQQFSAVQHPQYFYPTVPQVAMYPQTFYHYGIAPNEVAAMSSHNNSSPIRNTRSDPRSMVAGCWTCGSSSHRYRQCTVKPKRNVCYRCGQEGHFAPACATVLEGMKGRSQQAVSRKSIATQANLEGNDQPGISNPRVATSPVLNPFL